MLTALSSGRGWPCCADQLCLGSSSIANFFGHASGKKPFEIARRYKAWLTVVRRHSENILPDASPKKCATPAGSAA